MKDRSPPDADVVPPVGARRRFLLRSAALLPAAGALSACEPKQGGQATTPGSENQVTGAPPAIEVPSAPRYFTKEEMDFVSAACARLIPKDEEGPGALELNVPIFIDGQLEGEFGHAARWYMQGPFKEAPEEFGYQSRLTPREVYRLGIAAVDRHCQQQYKAPFSALKPEDQEAVLHELDGKKLSFDEVSGKLFFDFLLGNVKEGYLADPMYGGNAKGGAWKMIGFTGARADFADWVGLDKPYPYAPVGVLGKEV